MCARFSLTSPIEAMRHLFGFTELPNLAASYNVAPGTAIPAIRRNRKNGAEGRQFFFAHWGLIPSWAKDRSLSSKLINARSETVAEKPSFRHAFKQQRCLIPCNGYYEWKKLEGGGKQPYLIYPRDKSLFALAGLWEEWQDDNNQLIESCTILTKPACLDLEDIHHRMPITVHPSYFDGWLNGKTRQNLPSQEHGIPLTFHPVSQKVGNVRNNDADLIRKIDLPKTLQQGSLF